MARRRTTRDPGDVLWGPRELARFLGVSVQSVESYASLAGAPKRYYLKPRCPRWFESEWRAFVRTRPTTTVAVDGQRGALAGE